MIKCHIKTIIKLNFTRIIDIIFLFPVNSFIHSGNLLIGILSRDVKKLFINIVVKIIIISIKLIIIIRIVIDLFDSFFSLSVNSSTSLVSISSVSIISSFSSTILFFFISNFLKLSFFSCNSCSSNIFSEIFSKVSFGLSELLLVLFAWKLLYLFVKSSLK